MNPFVKHITPVLCLLTALAGCPADPSTGGLCTDQDMGRDDACLVAAPCDQGCCTVHCLNRLAKTCDAVYRCDAATGEAVRVDDVPPCLSVCMRADGQCEERRMSDFSGFETVLVRSRTSEGLFSCDGPLSTIEAFVGECGDGNTAFLFRSSGEDVLVHYFELDSGRFIGLATASDGTDPECVGRGYWPIPVTCEDATVTEDICGGFAVGEPIGLP